MKWPSGGDHHGPPHPHHRPSHAATGRYVVDTLCDLTCQIIHAHYAPPPPGPPRDPDVPLPINPVRPAQRSDIQASTASHDHHGPRRAREPASPRPTEADHAELYGIGV